MVEPSPGAGLDHHLVAAMHQFGDARGGDGDAVLVVLDLSRDADAARLLLGRDFADISVKNIRRVAITPAIIR